MEASNIEEAISGEGTSESPFAIENEEQFMFISAAVTAGGTIKGLSAGSASYVLTSNLNLSQYATFFGIGNATNPFHGEFNGNDHTIILNINTTIESNVGLFRVTNGATIRNVIIEGSVRGVQYTGGIVGRSTNMTTLENVESRAAITGNGNHTGGIAGLVEGGSTINNATVSSAATVNGRNSTGGITGRLDGSTIENSRVHGTVTNTITTSSDYGGIVGVVANGRIENSEMWGNIQGRSATGGIAGSTTGATVIENSTVHSNVNGTSPVGNIVGNFGGTSVIRNTFGRGNQVNKSSGENLFVGSTVNNTRIEDSGYYIIGNVTPATATILINDIEHNTDLITRNINGDFEVLIPVSKTTGTTVATNNDIRTITFVQSGYKRESRVENFDQDRMVICLTILS
jgi:hypothetical protein